MQTQVPGAGTQPPTGTLPTPPASSPPATPPPAAPPPGNTLEGITPAQLQDLYKRSPDLFKDVVPVVPAAPPVAPSPVPGTGEDLKLELPKDANVDPKVLERFTETWKKAPPEKRAQAAVDFYLQLNKEAMAQSQADYANWRKTSLEKLKADPDWKDFEAAKVEAQRPLAKYADPEFAKELVQSGWDNHPGMARFLRKIGKAMGEDSTHRPPPVSQEVADQQKELLRRYDNPTSRGMSGMPPVEPQTP